MADLRTTGEPVSAEDQTVSAGPVHHDPARLLEGLRVLDLAGLQGQLTGRLLADLGAEVVKAEPPDGDLVRRLAPFAREGDLDNSLLFAFLGAGKRSIVLDPDRAEDQLVVAELLAWSQLVVLSADGAYGEQLVGPVLDLPERSGSVVVHLSPYGLGSPNNDLQSDLTVFALSGLLNISGSPDLPPCSPPEAQAFYYGCVWGALAGLSAWYRRDDDPRGELVDVSLCEALTTQEALIRAAATGAAIERGGSQHRLVAPSNLFRAKDGLVQLHVNHTAWQKFLRLLDGAVPELEDARWDSMDSRLEQVDRVNDLINGFTSTFTKEELVERAQLNGVACMPVNFPSEVLADTDMRERSTFVPVTHPTLGDYAQPSAPYVIDGLRLPGAPPPLLDADREEVLGLLARREDVVPTREATSGAAVEPPLHGTRIVTFTSGVAGPRAGRILAWLGADVIKVESRNGGVDSFRYFGTGPDADLRLETSQRFAESNLNVSSVTIDLKSAEGKRLTRELIASCDVVMDNYRPGVLERLGFSDEEIRAVNPRAVVMHMPGFGSAGRRKNFGTWGPSVNAFTGMTALWNHPDQGFVTGTQSVYPDYLACVFGPLGIIAGLIARDRDGLANAIEYSQVEGAIYMLGVNYLYASVRGEDRPPQGNERDNCLKSGLLECAGDDRWCAYEIRDERDLKAVVALLGADAGSTGDLPAEPLDDLATWARGLPPAEVMRQLREVGVPAGTVRKGTELLEDPLFQAHGFVRAVDQPHIGELLVPYLPVQFRHATTKDPIPAPQLGSANERVICGDLGHDAAELAAWQQDGAVN